MNLCTVFIQKIFGPRRETSHCATLIDNIFTNDTENNTVSGLLINDISDHLPVYESKHKKGTEYG